MPQPFRKARILIPLAAPVTLALGLFVLILLPPQAPTRSATPAAIQTLDRRYASEIQPLLQKYCYACHGNGKHKGDITLDKFASFPSLQADHETAQAMSEQLESTAMPPEDKPQPTKAEMALLTSFVNETLTFRDCTGPRDPGKVTIRRLNRAEYNNTIRDLLGVDFKPAADFPADDTGYGFDNIGDVLSMSPLLAEKYLSAAEQVLDRAIITDPPKRQIFKHDGNQLASTSGGFTNGDAGWALTANGELFTKQEIPATGEYEIRFRAWGNQVGPDAVRMAIRLDGSPVKIFEVKALREQPQICAIIAPLRAGEHRISAAFLNEFTAPPAPERVAASITSEKPTAEKPAADKVSAEKRAADKATADKTTVKPAPDKNDKAVAPKPAPPKNAPAKPNKPQVRRLVIESLNIDGPKNSDKLPVPPPTEIHKKLVFSAPPKDGSEDACAKKVLEKFATRAFRRPTTDDELARLLKLFTSARTQGDKYDKALKTSMAAVLCSPHFLFRIEVPPAASPSAAGGSSASVSPGALKTEPLSDYAIASRLSYFLWSTMPDDDLFAAAAAGKLHQAGVIEAQIKRMMADPKSKAFITNFAGQWLELRLLDDYEADPTRFPAFNHTLRAAMKQEAEAFFQALVSEDRSILDLLDSNYTFLNDKLALFYGIPNITGSNFRKVDLTAANHRGGVLTMAGVLTVTAMPSRTSPVKRGKYILEQILGTPPPPPPPDVPALSEKKKDMDAASMRQRLEAHRTDPTCASCHKRMDPIGFALENYDAIGRWRDKDGNFPIDPSGVLPGGRKIAGPEDLKKALLNKKDDFVRCLATKMLTYAIGRGVEPSDRCTIDDICATVKQNNYRFSALLTGIVKSDAFQKRRAN